MVEEQMLSRMADKVRIFIPTTLYNMVLAVLPNALREEKRWDTCRLKKHPKECKKKKKSPTRTKWFNMDSGYKVNIQKPIAFLYTSNGQLKIKNFKTCRLTFRLQQVSNDCYLTEISIWMNIHMQKYLHKN